jgi:hypothetical protein
MGERSDPRVRAVHLGLPEGAIVIDLPARWAVLDPAEGDPLARISEVIASELGEWNGEHGGVVDSMDDGALMELTTGVQAALLASLRNLSADLPASLLAVGVDMAGDDGALLLSTFAACVLEAGSDSGDTWGVTDEFETRGGLRGGGGLQPGLDDDAAAGAWYIRLDELGAAIVLQAEARGPAAVLLPPVWRWVVESVRVELKGHSHV